MRSKIPYRVKIVVSKETGLIVRKEPRSESEPVMLIHDGTGTNYEIVEESQDWGKIVIPKSQRFTDSDTGWIYLKGGYVEIIKETTYSARVTWAYVKLILMFILIFLTLCGIVAFINVLPIILPILNMLFSP